MKKRFGWMGLVAAAAIALSASLAQSADQQFVRMFSGPEGGSWYPL